MAAHLNDVLTKTESVKKNAFIQKTLEKQKKALELKKDDLINKTINEINALQEAQWLTGHGYVAPHFPLFSDKLENVESGLYIFSGESNSGKTAVMTNVFWDLVLEPSNNLYGIYISLDDTKKLIYPRIIAMDQMIPIGCVKKPAIYQEKAKEAEFNHYHEYLAKREIGFENLKERAHLATILDATDEEVRNDENIFNFLKKILEAVKKIDETANILVAIDAIDDIALKNPEDDKASAIARTVKNWAINLDIPIFVSKHLKKLNGNRRPILDDLRDANTLVYEANVIFLVFNDVSKNKDNAKVFYTEDDSDTKCPVIELDWAKNKNSSFKGITFCHFIPEFSKVLECTETQGKHYQGSIYNF